MQQEKPQRGAALKEKLKKKWNSGGVTLWGAVLFAALLAFDLITKALAENFLADGKEIDVFGGLIRFRLVYNRGISFGMFSDGSAGVKIAIIIGTFVMMFALAVLYAFVDKRRKPLRISLIFIVAGGIGNLIDRILYRVWLPDAPKGVRDMVDVSAIRFGSFDFGICNFADFFITAGAIVLVLSFLFFDSDALFPSAKSKKLAETIAAESGEGQADITEKAQEGQETRKSEESETKYRETDSDQTETGDVPRATGEENNGADDGS